METTNTETNENMVAETAQTTETTEIAETDEVVQETHSTATTAEVESETQQESVPEDIELVGIPYINDGKNAQLFFNSMFTGEKVVDVVRKYFFEKFDNDDQPKWDGVYMCDYNFSKNEIVKSANSGAVSYSNFRTAWLYTRSGANDTITFNVKCTMPKNIAYQFQSLLKRMESYGAEGVDNILSFVVKGSGTCKPKFTFSTELEDVSGISSEAIPHSTHEVFNAF